VTCPTAFPFAEIGKLPGVDAVASMPLPWASLH
jgi:hypothetical protein